MIGIYKVESPSGRIYIGQSWDIDRRFKGYKTFKCSKEQRLLYRSLNKYGPNSHIFNILYEFPEDIDQKVLDNYEIFYYNHYKELNFKMLNIREAGKGGKHSAETIRRMSLSQKSSYRNNPKRITNRRKVYQYDLNGVFLQGFDSIKEASSKLNIRAPSISGNLRKITCMACGYLFSYEKHEQINKYSGPFVRVPL